MYIYIYIFFFFNGVNVVKCTVSCNIRVTIDTHNMMQHEIFNLRSCKTSTAGINNTLANETMLYCIKLIL